MTAMNIFGWVLCGLGVLDVLVTLVAIITISCMNRNEKTKLEKTEPEKTEPEKTEPEKTEPEKTEPEKTEPEKTEPEKTEPEKTEPEKKPETESDTEKKPHKEWQTQSLDLDPEPEKKPEPEKTEPEKKPELSADEVRAIAQEEIAKEKKAVQIAERKNYLSKAISEAKDNLDKCDALIKDVEAEISRLDEAENSFKENQAKVANRRRLMARVNAFDGSQTAKANQVLYGPMKTKEGLDAANAGVDAKKAEEEATLGNFQEQDDLYDAIKNPDEAYYNRLVEILERLYEDRDHLQKTYNSLLEEFNKLP